MAVQKIITVGVAVGTLLTMGCQSIVLHDFDDQKAVIDIEGSLSTIKRDEAISLTVDKATDVCASYDKLARFVSVDLINKPIGSSTTQLGIFTVEQYYTVTRVSYACR